MIRTRTRWKRFREAKGMSQKQLALALGITRRAVSYIESGQREPWWKTQEAFDQLVERHARERLNG